MTDKTIINSVDVSGCEFFFRDNINGIFTQELCACMEEHTGTNSYKTQCLDNSNCYYKQLHRTKAQYNAVVEQNKSLQGELKQKEQECEVLKEEINILKNNFDSSNRDWDELLEGYEQAFKEIKFEASEELKELAADTNVYGCLLEILNIINKAKEESHEIDAQGE